MGNRPSRESELRQQDVNDWQRLRTEIRPADAHVGARGLGVRRFQIIVLTSAAEPRAWEARQLDRQWWLFESQVTDDWPIVQLTGYEPQDVDSNVLQSYFERVIRLKLPLSPLLSHEGGLGGTITEFAIFGSQCSQCRFRWWSDAPPLWKSLTDLADEMISTFSALPRANVRQDQLRADFRKYPFQGYYGIEEDL